MSEMRAVLLHCSFKARATLRWPLGHSSRLAPSSRSHVLLTAPEMTSRADTHPWLQCARHPVCHLLSKLSAITEKVRIGARGRDTSKGWNIFFFRTYVQSDWFFFFKNWFWKLLSVCIRSSIFASYFLFQRMCRILSFGNVWAGYVTAPV